jgi:hypothetical protein
MKNNSTRLLVIAGVFAAGLLFVSATITSAHAQGAPTRPFNIQREVPQKHHSPQIG